MEYQFRKFSIEFKSLNVTSEKACVIVTSIVEIFGFNLHINVLN